MPLVRITVPDSVPADQRAALAAGVHRALVEVAKAPADDRFQILEVAPPEAIVFTPSYLGLTHRAPVVVVQVFMNVGRTVEVKKALYAALADNITAAAPVRREDVAVGRATQRAQGHDRNPVAEQARPPESPLAGL
jgi:phenylpyruvate tautomerase PptA (4-oxalocrotonate tautomerase family)